MKTISTLFLLCISSLFFSFAALHAQAIVVSEYYSTSSMTGIGEWTEVVVIDDNVDLRNYKLIDNNSGQSTPQGGVKFKPISFWQHVRRGTAIVIHHRDEATVTEDTDPADGYLELKATNTTYFDQHLEPGITLPWDNTALNVASGGDILEIFNPANVHIHALCHRTTPGPYYANTMPDPKPNLGSSLPDNSSVAVVPGASISDFNSRTGAQNLSTPTKGLPNSAANSTMWRELREPSAFSNTGLTLNANAGFTSIALSWTAIDDDYSADQITGYIVLRSMTNTFTPPADGFKYAVGASLGGATVIAHVTGSGSNSYTDNVGSLTIPCGQKVYYRVYPYRYDVDNVNGNNYDAARGRAYNTTSFASQNVEKSFNGQALITVSDPLAFCEGGSAQLQATPAGTSYQWQRGGNPISGATGTSYTATASGSYTVLITAANGCTSLSAAVTITVRPIPTTSIAGVSPQCLRNNSFSFSQSGFAGAAYSWEFGDGALPATSTDEDPIGISYITPGTKLVKLTVTKDGCTFTTSQTVQVNANPSLSISPIIPICEGDSIKIVATAPAGVTYRWTGPDGLSSYTSPDPWAKPKVTSTYILTATDPTSGCTDQQSVTVTVLPKPRAHIQSNGPTTVCTGGTITLSDDGSGGGGQFTWLPDFQSGPILTVTHTKEGVYIYRVVLISGNGCRDTSNAIAITVSSKPDAFVNTPEGTTVCRGQKVKLAANEVPGATYKWNNGEDTREIQAGPGVYKVTVSIGDGCEASSTPVTVTERAPSFSLSSKVIKFGELGKCESSTETMVVITNTGKEDLTFSATASPHFAIPGNFVIARNSSQTLSLRFAPSGGAGVYKGRIYITAAPCGIIDSIDVEGTKVGTSDAVLNLASITYPSRLFCATEVQDTTITLSNAGTDDLRVTFVHVDAPFELRSHASTDFPIVLKAGTSEQFTFRYAPTIVGPAQRDAVLRYEIGDCRDSLRVSLTGLYEQPSLASDRSVLRFSALPGCEAYRDSIVVVTNTGSMPISIDASFVPPGEFSVQQHSSQLLAPGARDTMVVRFRPSGSGLRKSTMQVRETLCNTVQEIELEGIKQGISFAATNNISFAPLVAPCAVGSTTAVITISNTSEEQANGSVVSAVLKNSSPEFQVSIPSGTPLPNGQQLSFNVSFTPSSDGYFADTLLLHLEPCDVIKMIPLAGMRGTAQLDKTGTEVVLAPQKVGDAINASVIFRNAGSVPVTVESIQGVAAPFTLLDVAPVLPALLAPDSILVVTVKYTADDGLADTIRVHAVYSTSNCAMVTDSTAIIGQGIAPPVIRHANVKVSMPTLQGKPGEEIAFPLVLESDDIDTAQVTGLRAYLSFNGTMLLPISAAAGPAASGLTASAVETQPGQLTLALSSTSSELIDTGVVANLRFRVLLGGAMTTPIAIDSMAFDAAVNVEYGKSSGMFILTDSCNIATRLLTVSGATSLGIISSDGNSTVAEFSTAYDGPVELVLYDVLGRQAASPLNGEMRSGVYRLVVPTGTLPEGMYFLVMRASGIAKTVGVPVVR